MDIWNILPCSRSYRNNFNRVNEFHRIPMSWLGNRFMDNICSMDEHFLTLFELNSILKLDLFRKIFSPEYNLHRADK